jgi:opacity protein-like surface antigen
LGFVTGGVAIGRSPDYFSASANGFIASSPSAPLVGAATVSRGDLEQTLYGYSIGGGLEVKMSRNFRLRTEYIYDDYGSFETKLIGGAGFGGTIGDLTTNSFVSTGNEFDLSSQTVRVTGIFQF